MSTLVELTAKRIEEQRKADAPKIALIYGGGIGGPAVIGLMVAGPMGGIIGAGIGYLVVKNYHKFVGMAK